MPWARALVNINLGSALVNYWDLSPLETQVLSMASRRELTETEEAAEEKKNQQLMAAHLGATRPPPKPLHPKK